MSNYYQPNGGGCPNGTAPPPPPQFQWRCSVAPASHGSGSSGSGRAPATASNAEYDGNNYCIPHDVRARETEVTASNHHSNNSMGGHASLGSGDNNCNSITSQSNPLAYNSISRQNGASQQMSRWGAKQHVGMQPQYHQQRHDYLGHQPPLPLPLDPHPNPVPEALHHFSHQPQIELRQLAPPPLPPPLPPQLPPPPPPSQENSSHLTESHIRHGLNPPPPAPPILPASSSRDPNNDINQAVDAISALSNLEQRWFLAPAATGKRQHQVTSGVKNAKRKKRRRKHKKNNNEADNKARSTSEDLVIIRDAGEWMDVNDTVPSNALRTVIQPALFDLAMNEGANEFPPLQAGDGDPRMVSLKHDFPPLASTSREYGVAQADPLASYASVLQQSLEHSGGTGVNLNSMNQVIQFLEEYDDDEEMDISDEDHDIQISQDAGEYEMGDGATDANLSIDVSVDGTDAPSMIVNEQEMRAMEKRALKLAELKAKAKLARAKLRMAEEKKARGQRARGLPESAEVGSLNRTDPLINEAPSRHSTLPLSDRLPDITAIQDPIDEIRFVNSGLQDSVEIKDANQSIIPIEVSKPQLIIAPPSTLADEENGTKAKTLKQKLHLARLKLEIKKKERELEMKRNSNSTRGLDSEVNHPPAILTKNDTAPKQLENTTRNPQRLEYESLPKDLIYSGTKDNIASENNSEPTELRDKKALGAKLQQLRKRQKELKQQNDNANLRNLIHRQRGLLQAQRQDLIEISSQLRSCIDGLKSKQELLEQSESRVEEMKHRKRIVEGMGLRATEQLIAARKSLSERRMESAGPLLSRKRDA